MKKIKNFFFKSPLILFIKRTFFWLAQVKIFYFFFQNLKENLCFPNNKHNTSKKKIAIIVHPWLLTPAPFFSIVTGIFLSKRGTTVDFIIDDIYFDNFPIIYRIQLASINYFARRLKSNYKIIKISNLHPVIDNGIISDEYLRDLAYQNTVHHMKGELNEKGRKEYFNQIYSQLINARPYIYAFFFNSNYDNIHISGGVYGTTGLYLKYAKHYNIGAHTFDSGFGILMTSINGVSAHLSDIPTALRLLNSDSNLTTNIKAITNHVNELISKRKSGTDIFSSQVQGTEKNIESKSVGVLILLNSSWDSAALGLHTIFDSYASWLTETVDFILNNTNQVITIRQHPAERFEEGKSNDDFQEHIKNKFNNNNRIIFIDCYAKINTYGLIEKANLIICFSSTSAMESVILGKNVIVGSNCYYSNESFVSKPKSLSNYHELIIDGIEGKLLNSQKSIEQAYLCYYLGQCCNWLVMNYTPMPSDFKIWGNMKPAQVFEMDLVQDYLYSIENNIPMSILQHERIITNIN